MGRDRFKVLHASATSRSGSVRATHEDRFDCSTFPTRVPCGNDAGWLLRCIGCTCCTCGAGASAGPTKSCRREGCGGGFGELTVLRCIAETEVSSNSTELRWALASRSGLGMGPLGGATASSPTLELQRVWSVLGRRCKTRSAGGAQGEEEDVRPRTGDGANTRRFSYPSCLRGHTAGKTFPANGLSCCSTASRLSCLPLLLSSSPQPHAVDPRLPMAGQISRAKARAAPNAHSGPTGRGPRAPPRPPCNPPARLPALPARRVFRETTADCSEGRRYPPVWICKMNGTKVQN